MEIIINKERFEDIIQKGLKTFCDVYVKDWWNFEHFSDRFDRHSSFKKYSNLSELSRNEDLYNEMKNEWLDYNMGVALDEALIESGYKTTDEDDIIRFDENEENYIREYLSSQLDKSLSNYLDKDEYYPYGPQSFYYKNRNWKINKAEIDYLNYIGDGKDVKLPEGFNNKSLYSLFYCCDTLKTIDLSNIDTSDKENISSLFAGCTAIQKLDVSKFDTSNIKYMNGTFMGCESLESLDVSNFDTSKVEDMGEMFYRCSSLKELDLSNFDTSKVKHMYKMFMWCESLEVLNLTNFNTSHLEDLEYSMENMFSHCPFLTTVITNNEMIINQLRKDLPEEQFNQLNIINPSEIEMDLEQ